MTWVYDRNIDSFKQPLLGTRFTYQTFCGKVLDVWQCSINLMDEMPVKLCGHVSVITETLVG
jgi:hypothetical protein